MRVVSGDFKGKILKAVPGRSTRPTTDKVKEAIFNMIGPYFDGGTCLDLFAGSGGLGLEALSRGVEKAIFIDKDQKAIQTIYDNVKTCQCGEKVEIYRNESMRALKALIKRSMKFDCIFLDPPYKMDVLTDIIQIIDDHELLHHDGVIVCEHSFDVSLPSEIARLTKTKLETYGIISISIYRYE